MGKSKHYGKEFELVDRLKHENEKLKRELKQVRKLLDRFECAQEKGLIEDNAIIPGKKRIKEQELIERWKCYECESGVLRLIIVGNRYFRKCDGCGKHTKSQVWDPNLKKVEGVPSK